MTTTGPNLGFTYGFTYKEDGWGDEYNADLQKLDALVLFSVKAIGDNAPPGSPASGDRYIVGSSPSGDWSGHAGELALYLVSAWVFYSVSEGWILWDEGTDAALAYNGSSWVNVLSLQQASARGGFETYDASGSRTVGTERIIFCDTSGGAFDVTLPAASGVQGIPLRVIKTTTDTNAVTVKAAGGQIEGVAGATGIAIGGSGRDSGLWVSDGADFWRGA